MLGGKKDSKATLVHSLSRSAPIPFVRASSSAELRSGFSSRSPERKEIIGNGHRKPSSVTSSPENSPKTTPESSPRTDAGSSSFIASVPDYPAPLTPEQEVDAPKVRHTQRLSAFFKSPPSAVENVSLAIIVPDVVASESKSTQDVKLSYTSIGLVNSEERVVETTSSSISPRDNKNATPSEASTSNFKRASPTSSPRDKLQSQASRHSLVIGECKESNRKPIQFGSLFAKGDRCSGTFGQLPISTPPGMGCA